MNKRLHTVTPIVNQAQPPALVAVDISDGVWTIIRLVGSDPELITTAVKLASMLNGRPGLVQIFPAAVNANPHDAADLP